MTASHYWRNLAYFLDEKGFPFRLINQFTLKRRREGKEGYLFIVDDEHLAWPAHEYFRTERNIQGGSKVQLLVALREEHNG